MKEEHGQVLVNTITILVTEQEASACIKEIENSGNDDDNDDDYDKESFIRNCTYYHLEEFILDAEEQDLEYLAR